MKAAPYISAVLLIVVGLLVFSTSKEKRAFEAERAGSLAEVSSLKEKLELVESRLAETEKERDRLKATAAEVHSLRGELSTLRKAAEAARRAESQPAPKAPGPETATAPPFRKIFPTTRK